MIRDEFTGQVDVKVTAWQLPVINRELMNGDIKDGQKLMDVFETIELELKIRINQILNPHIFK